MVTSLEQDDHVLPALGFCTDFVIGGSSVQTTAIVSPFQEFGSLLDFVTNFERARGVSWKFQNRTERFTCCAGKVID